MQGRAKREIIPRTGQNGSTENRHGRQGRNVRRHDGRTDILLPHTESASNTDTLMLAKYLALLVSTAKALPTPPPERCHHLPILVSLVSSHPTLSHGRPRRRCTGPDCLSVSLPPFAQGGANTFLGGVPPLHNILLSIDHPELCQHGQPYDLFGKSCNGLAMFVTPPNCADLAPEEQLTQACVSSLTPPNASIVGGDALGKSIDIRTETRMREVIESSTKAEGNGYGVTAKGSLHFLQSGHTTRTSAVLGTEAVAMHVRHQTLFNPHLLRLTEYFKRMFRLGPAAWNSAQFSHFFVTGIFYGGYFSGTCVMTSKTEGAGGSCDCLDLPFPTFPPPPA